MVVKQFTPYFLIIDSWKKICVGLKIAKNKIKLIIKEKIAQDD